MLDTSDIAKRRAYAREHYRRNRAEYLERARLWAASNPDKSAEAKRKWRRENREKGLAASKRWHRENSERTTANVMRWREENPDKFLAIQINRRARVAANGGHITCDEIEEIVRRQKGRCAVCRKKRKLEMDHVMPVKLGGDSWARNFQGLCRSCNASKSAKHPIDFSRSLGLLL